MDRDEAKSQIAALVEKYSEVAKDKDAYRRYNEEMTKLRFINPLFQALGWDIENMHRRDEVTFEDQISKGRVDYGFRINGIPKFFLEAKSLKANIDDPTFAKQAIDYSWNKGCTWAVLTDFETIKIFNAEWRESDYSRNHLKTINVHEFVSRFDELWLLSKDSFHTGLLDKQAENWGKKTKKTPVDKQLLADFTRFRELLSKNIAKVNSGRRLTIDDLNESVQRILDRLIFIRYCEDRELEERKLLSYLREWEGKGKGQLIRSLRDVFLYFDKHYDSKIFAKHQCDELDIDNAILNEIIEGLHFTRDRTISYDFSAIEADVLGNIYEQYLGHILRKTEKRATLTASQAHRKEQGIFYTPTYIVDYIVRNTLGRLLEEKKLNEIPRLRILDPACGSGSFLIKSFDYLNDFYMRNQEDYGQTRLDLKEENATYTKKLEILQNHIFGVDLDRQAVEVAQLNLLLKIAEKGRRLPLLQQNVKHGNSIIEKSLNEDDKAFDWNTHFDQIMRQDGGFDVIVGNPPYVRQEELVQLKSYLQSAYETFDGAADLFVYFFERELRLLKEGGYLGMIVSSKWLKADYGKKLRRFLNQYWIEQFIDFGDLRVFEDATTYPCIIIIKKKKKQNHAIKVCQILTLKFESLESYIDQNSFKVSQTSLIDERWTFQRIVDFKMLDKIKRDCIPLREYVDDNVYRGIVTGYNEAFIIDEDTKKKLLSQDKRNIEIIKPFLMGDDVKRYAIDSKRRFIIFTRRGIDISKYPSIEKHLVLFKQQLSPKKSAKDTVGRKPGDYKWYEIQDATAYYMELERPKILFGELQTSPRFTLDKEGHYVGNKLFFFPIPDEHLLGILNSKMCWYLIQRYCTRIMNGYNVSWSYFGNIPIPRTKDPELELLVRQMLKLSQEMLALKNRNTDRIGEIETERLRIDSEINQKVFALYGITNEEIKIIEDSVKR